jgi:hypothetical protein
VRSTKKKRGRDAPGWMPCSRQYSSQHALPVWREREKREERECEREERGERVERRERRETRGGENEGQKQKNNRGVVLGGCSGARARARARAAHGGSELTWIPAWPMWMEITSRIGREFRG